ncbi:hypothetical protein JXB02_04115 [Candidatus Woesearchaeota archaeon]|nr:hypothetical protein [Candidatus Woesearchaeota archaeon]
MYPLWHLLLSAAISIFAILKLNVGPLEVSLIVLGGFLIDADHYLIYIINKRRFGIRAAYRYFKGSPRAHLCVFHTAEFMLLTLFFMLYLPVLGWFLAGLASHLLLDIIEDVVMRFYKMHEGRIYFLIPYLLWGKVLFKPSGRLLKSGRRRADEH